jgi:Icc-related predicted phosphoesterase
VLRILHVSDIHVEVPFAELPKGELVSKRAIGLMNLWLRRGWRFRDVPAKLEALARFREAEKCDLVLLSGDLTALGTEPELRRARQLIEPLIGAPMGCVVVPGNHDLYLGDAARDGRFEFRFGDLMESDVPEVATQTGWPFVKLFGDKVAVIAVNSARPNPQPWRSSGRIPHAQLAGLARAVEHPKVRGRFIIVMTHYAPRRADGTPDTFRHGLENYAALETACAGIAHGMLIHGHLHDCFHTRPPGAPIPFFGAGSATDAKHNGLWIYELGGAESRALRGTWGGSGYALDGTVVPLDGQVFRGL